MILCFFSFGCISSSLGFCVLAFPFSLLFLWNYVIIIAVYAYNFFPHGKGIYGFQYFKLEFLLAKIGVCFSS